MAQALPAILPMRPYLREMVWGGQRLGLVYGKPLPAGKRIGESFEVSAWPGRESVVAAGPLAGWGMDRVLAEYRDQVMDRSLWERCSGAFPLLVKLLDAHQDLSIQVHPGDQYAREKGLGWWGKTEAWFVLQSAEGRVACGLRAGVGPEALRLALEAGRPQEVVEFHAVQSGDVVSIPAGTVHALGAGMVVYEVQQSSDATYRLYDHGRPGLDGKPRELHLEQSLEVALFGAGAPRPTSWRSLPDAQVDRAVLVENQYFTLTYYRPDRQSPRIGHAADDSFLALTLLHGQAEIRGGADSFGLAPGDTVVVPANRECVLVPRSEAGLEYLIAAVPN
jgi:mannose-6-phosphate isomerase